MPLEFYTRAPSVEDIAIGIFSEERQDQIHISAINNGIDNLVALIS